MHKLAAHRLLSIKQMQAAGAGRDAKHLRLLVQDLRTQKLVRALPDENRKGEAAVTRFKPGEGRRALLYYLSPAGARALGELTGQPPPEVRAKPYNFSSKVEEWEAITDTHLALDAWCGAAGARLDFFQADFQPGAAGLERATRMPFVDTTQRPPAPDNFTPDAVAGLTQASGAIQLLVVEVYTGGWQSRVGHFRDQLPHLATVAMLGVPERHWRLDQLGRSARYLILFRTAAMRVEALSRWPDSGAEHWGRFFIKSLDELADFNGGWHQPNGARRALFHG
ncbi:hypothetical protein [Methylobacterium indicum]|uniref:Replication-relaxation n=1 Tax=Methylobacterium indicum TaxID=1775910 RepID=A0ABR5HGK5_9HYPH|nr:hypothetical protein [Methylobacterium indicum]KMO12800.1 hypothetical protein QR78_26510 [Methylobacterium indicum]KMO25782.1 hypothetical protein QR79_05965 [Methylobacterium indicum]